SRGPFRHAVSGYAPAGRSPDCPTGGYPAPVWPAGAAAGVAGVAAAAAPGAPGGAARRAAPVGAAWDAADSAERSRLGEKSSSTVIPSAVVIAYSVLTEGCDLPVSICETMLAETP